MRLKVWVSGIVQGVGFRPFVYRIATKNQLKGYVRNRGDAGVEILLEGQKQNISAFLQNLEEEKPALAQIYEVLTVPLRGKDEYGGFTVRKSSEEVELSGSVIPPDVAICNQCLREMRTPNDRRYDYFFITCTDCGPRYSIIEKLPYDRQNTAMRDFSMCAFCKTEFKTPTNRRFHAQTVACPKCGPKVYLTNNKGETLVYEEPVQQAGKLLSEGFIVAIKGYGGFHVAASTVLDAPLNKLRTAKHRSQKPFAVMSHSLEATKTFAEMSSKEEELLTSFQRPIVLLNKKDDYYLSELISPGLHNIGVMLPYTGLHYMLFDEVADSAFVMTSANPPNQPIIKDDDEALKRLGEIVDFFLFHNRKIAHRCDDSVLRTHGHNQVFIRRSRGYAPAALFLKKKAEQCAIGLGGEQNNTSCVIAGDKAFISQHIGDVENVENREFLSEATERLIRITNSKVEAVACDLHPKFTTTILAQELAERNGWELFQVQHHYAHIAALMAEHGVEEMVGVCCDGYGYGLEGESWGGEILLCNQGEYVFERLAHLEKQPLIGGDAATRYPLRVAAGILRKHSDIREYLLRNRNHFPHGDAEVQILLQQLEKDKGFMKTTSCGRILDAIAAILGICYERTYEGEPAMKLETAALEGRDSLRIEPIISRDALNTTEIVSAIFEQRQKMPLQNLAYSIHSYLARGLASIAVQKALENNVRTIGFSGGVACNQIMTAVIRRFVESCGLKLFMHESVPPGDGCISFGQAVVAGH